jgi:hypothetical protein
MARRLQISVTTAATTPMPTIEAATFLAYYSLARRQYESTAKKSYAKFIRGGRHASS